MSRPGKIITKMISTVLNKANTIKVESTCACNHFIQSKHFCGVNNKLFKYLEIEEGRSFNIIEQPVIVLNKRS